MRGHLPLLAMRRHGLVPPSVSLSTAAQPFADDWHLSGESIPQIAIEPNDSIPLLDLRFLVGLTVFVDGSDRDRCERLHAACMEAKAKRVLTHVSRPGKRRGDFEIWLQIIDNQTVYESE